jgi:hypothetical protein
MERVWASHPQGLARQREVVAATEDTNAAALEEGAARTFLGAFDAMGPGFEDEGNKQLVGDFAVLSGVLPGWPSGLRWDGFRMRLSHALRSLGRARN